MKILYIGGTGQISFDCVRETVKAGHEVWVFNRGNRNAGLPEAVKFLAGDMNDDADYGQIVGEGFDVICQFRVFTADKLQRDLDLFTPMAKSGTLKQYVYISSASAYEKPVKHHVITEEVPRVNPYWPYSRAKAECEALLVKHAAENVGGGSGGRSGVGSGGGNGGGFPYTIVRPSHTSRDQLTTAMGEGDLVASRMLRGKAVIVPGDGTSLWTITASEDFAPPFVKLLGNDKAIGEDFHLTSERAFMWSAIYLAIGRALGLDKEPELVGVPTDTLVRYKADWAGPLWGDKSWSVMFDNSKIKSVVGDFSCDTTLDAFMAKRVADFRARGDVKVNEQLDALHDRIIKDQCTLGGE